MKNEYVFAAAWLIVTVFAFLFHSVSAVWALVLLVFGFLLRGLVPSTPMMGVEKELAEHRDAINSIALTAGLAQPLFKDKTANG